MTDDLPPVSLSWCVSHKQIAVYRMQSQIVHVVLPNEGNGLPLVNVMIFGECSHCDMPTVTNKIQKYYGCIYLHMNKQI
jgi:hypothetical protein